MTPSNATIELYRGRDGLWRARVEWTDPETGEQRCNRARMGTARNSVTAAVARTALWFEHEVGLAPRLPRARAALDETEDP